MAVQFVGRGNFPHHNGTLPLWDAAADPDGDPRGPLTLWMVGAVMDFGNGYVGLVENPWFTPEVESTDEAGVYTGAWVDSPPQFRISIIELAKPEKAVRQVVVTMPYIGPISNYEIRPATLPLGAGRVLLAGVGANWNPTSNPDIQLGFPTVVISFDGSTLTIGEWTTIKFPTGIAGTSGYPWLVMSSANQPYLISYSNFNIDIIRLTVTGLTISDDSTWARATTEADPYSGHAADYIRTVFTVANGVVRMLYWRTADSGAGEILSVAQFRFDGGGWARRTVDADIASESPYAAYSSAIYYVTTQGDKTQVTYFRYKDSYDDPDAGGDDYLIYRIATITSSDSSWKDVLEIPPDLKDGAAGLNSRGQGSNLPTKGSVDAALPAPVAASNGSGELVQVGIYGQKAFASVEPEPGNTNDANWTGAVSTSRGYILLVTGGVWTSADPSEEAPTTVSVFHWSPGNDLTPGGVTERGYFS